MEGQIGVEWPHIQMHNQKCGCSSKKEIMGVLIKSGNQDRLPWGGGVWTRWRCVDWRCVAARTPGRVIAGAKALWQSQECVCVFWEGVCLGTQKANVATCQKAGRVWSKRRTQRWAGPGETVGKDLISSPRVVGSHWRVLNWRLTWLGCSLQWSSWLLEGIIHRTQTP